VSSAHLGRRLADRVAARESQVMLGLDPDPARLWPEAAAAAEGTGGASATPHDRAAAAVLAHCSAVIDAVAPAVVAVKPQVACFERLGPPGWAVLAGVCEHARGLGLLVLADAKRGDIDVTARAYAEAFLGSTPSPFGTLEGLGADAMTAAPYMGEDTLRPLLEVARPHGRGIFVLVRTSNPGAADLEDLETAGGRGPVWAHVARIVDRLGREAPEAGGGGEAAGAGEGGIARTSNAAGEGDGPGPGGTRDAGAGERDGLTDVGAVVGATGPEHVARLRELMPRTPFLLPGIGAQGGRVEDLAPAWAPGRAGGLVTASRSIVRAHEAEGAGDPATAARREAERLRDAAWSLA